MLGGQPDRNDALKCRMKPDKEKIITLQGKKPSLLISQS